jgi:hypothetical protein
VSRVLRLPSHGRLLVCTDLQGCLRDYHRIVELFMQAMDATGGDAHVIFTGDLVHGPHIEIDDWPDFLGEYYRDKSAEVVDEFVSLAFRHPGHVHALLGNHEHGHIGGPHTAKFAVDEVVVLEQHLGPAGSQRLREIFETFPLAAVAPCGAVFTHGAPAAVIDSIADVEATNLQMFDCDSPLDILDVPVLGPILWARSAQPDRALAFVTAMGGTISIYGHDVIPEGFERIGDEQMVVSTSFGVFDSNKVYLSLDLGASYKSVHDLRIGHEILPLYPDKAPRSLGGTADELT